MLAHLLVLSLGCIQHPDPPRVRNVEVVTKYSAQIVLQNTPIIFPDNQPLKDGAVQCYISLMESTGLFKDVKVDLKPTEDGKWIDILIRIAWAPEAKSYWIGEIDFEGFDSFDVSRIREELWKKGFHTGIPLFEYSPMEIADMIWHICEGIYSSDETMTDLFHELRLANPRFSFQVMHNESVKVHISLLRPDPCQF